MKRRRSLRTPAERVGLLPNADIPPPARVPGLEDPILLRALRDRDEHAFRRAIERYFSPMLRLARVYVRTHDEAEEVVQETWLAALRGFGRFRGKASLRTWLFRILRNRARSHGRRRAREVPFSQLGLGSDMRQPEREASAEGATWPLASIPATNRTPEDDVLAGELRTHIERALAELPARQREVLVLRDVRGWSSDEVRAALGLSQQNQRVLLHRARSKARALLRPYLLEADEDVRVA